MDIYTKRHKRFTKKLLILLLPILCVLILWIVFFRWPAKKNLATKNVVLITLDTQRSDYISAYNPEKAQTPNIDSLSSQGVTYENCYSLIPITLPSHASLFYSQPPHKLEIYNNGQMFRKAKRKTSLAEIFQKHGYTTGAFISLGVLKSSFQLNHGFDLYEDTLPENRWYLDAREVNEKAFPWLRRNKEKKFFVWLHYSDPHDPYAPPALSPDVRIILNGNTVKELCVQKFEQVHLKLKLESGDNTLLFQILHPFPDNRDDFRVRLNNIVLHEKKDLQIGFDRISLYERDGKTFALIKDQGTLKIFNPGQERELIITASGELNLLSSEKKDFYRQEVEYMDTQIGELLKKMDEFGLSSKTVVVLVGDHGEGLGEYKTRFGDSYFGHIHFLYDAYMKVPLIIFDPYSQIQGRRVKETATLLDIAPTILSLLGWRKIPFHEGRDLTKINQDSSVSFFEETYRPEAVRDRFALFQFPWHLILSPEDEQYEFYNLNDDPEEKENIYEGEILSSVQRQLKNKLDSFVHNVLKRKKEIKLEKNAQEMLRALGYIR